MRTPVVQIRRFFNGTKMREKLKELGSKTAHHFKGVVDRTGTRNSKNGPIETILIKHITYKGNIVAGHLWFNYGTHFRSLKLQKGDLITFDARVTLYRKKNKKLQISQIDYCLSSPTKITKIAKGELTITMKTKNTYEVVNYKTKDTNIPVRFDFKNRTIWLSQAEISKITGINSKTLSRRLIQIGKAENFDLQASKMRMTINKREVNVYSSLFLFQLKALIQNDYLNLFIDWCETIFATNDYDNYKLVIFTQDNLSLEVRFTNDYENAWLSQLEIAELYDVTRENIAQHIRNILSQGELNKVSVCKYFLHTASDGKQYPVEHYNLDMILSIGYRVNGKRGIAFRKWANNILKDYLIKGYAINEKKLSSLGKTIVIQNKMLASLMEVDFQELSTVINEYTQALDLLDDYDHQNLSKPKGRETTYELTYDDARSIIDSMKFNLDSTIFGVEKEEGKLEGILAAVYQNVFGQEVYPSLEDKAAHLLYFLVKDHPFYDGCKRIAATLFLEFLNRNNALIKKGQLAISKDALAAVTLLTAESNPEEMETITTVIMRLLAN